MNIKSNNVLNALDFATASRQPVMEVRKASIIKDQKKTDSTPLDKNNPFV